MNILLCIAANTLLTVFLWVLYLAVMNMKRNQDKATMVSKSFGYPVYFVGLIVDLIYNITVASVIFLELPRELLLTGRLQRHVRGRKGGWRYDLASWFCANFLDPFDPAGQHC